MRKGRGLASKGGLGFTICVTSFMHNPLNKDSQTLSSCSRAPPPHTKWNLRVKSNHVFNPISTWIPYPLSYKLVMSVLLNVVWPFKRSNEPFLRWLTARLKDAVKECTIAYHLSENCSSQIIVFMLSRVGGDTAI